MSRREVIDVENVASAMLHLQAVGTFGVFSEREIEAVSRMKGNPAAVRAAQTQRVHQRRGIHDGK